MSENTADLRSSLSKTASRVKTLRRRRAGAS